MCCPCMESPESPLSNPMLKSALATRMPEISSFRKMYFFIIILCVGAARTLPLPVKLKSRVAILREEKFYEKYWY